MKRIRIEGEIVTDEWGEIYDYFGLPNTTAAKIRDGLDAADGEDVVIEVNSPGGDVSVGSEIYYMIGGYSGTVVADIVGMACSAATFAILSADKVRMVPSALFMIHETSMETTGNADGLRHDAEMLETANKGLADVYAEKTGLEKDFILALMAEETWMNARDCEEYGFIDEVLTPERLVAGFGVTGEAERQRMKKEFEAVKRKAAAELELLKLEIF